MRQFFVAVAGLIFAATCGAAQAKVAITVDKDNQQMTVSVDGVQRYTWPVSTGNPSHETPSGKFQTFRMEEDHYSKEFDDAPMPHSIFFTRQGHAIHGTDSVNRLGTPASHGCVRLSRDNASTLWDLVKAEGVLNTTVTLTGSSQVALARNPRPGRPAAVARRDAQPNYASSPDFDAAGNPVALDPQASALQPLPPARQIAPRRVIPQPQVADDGYIYPADGSTGRYPAPRGYRRGYDSQGNPRYYVDQGSQQGYGEQLYGQPQPYYQQQRGYSAY